nr:MAG: ORF1 [TTV-like mini virus]
MPWYRRGYYRRRRLWTRRPRGPFRRRLWRKRRYHWRRPVRKRKLPYLPIRQWQPKYIRKLKVTLYLPLYMTTHSRITHNMTLYKETIAPHFLPSNGGFSITQITLQALFQQFQRARCWWSTSTIDYPLIRYLYTKLTLYRAQSSDYVICVHNCYPMKTSLEMYQSTQPSIMLITKGRKIVRCRKDNNPNKPYYKMKVPPPTQMTNKWFFQKDIAELPLIMWRASTLSLDRMFQPSNSISTTIGFTSLNTNFFQNHNWKTPSVTTGYHPKQGTYLYTYTSTTTDYENVQLQNLIYLGNSKDFQPGLPAGNKDQWNTYTTTLSKWGNIFIPPYLTGKTPILCTTKAPSQVWMNNYEATTNLKTVGGFTLCSEPFLRECRYNPFQDRGDSNQLYLVSITEPDAQWHAPSNPKYLTENLPLWLADWGFIDFMKAQGTAVDTSYVTAFHTNYMDPKDLRVVVPLDDDFLRGNSPFRPKDNLTPQDQQWWHPRTAFQYKSFNEIGASGPSTIKLPANVSAEGHLKCTLYFKLGGCVQPEKSIKDPQIQPVFPTPNNFTSSNSLQSPTTSIENFLYNFDWRRHYLTKAATKRMQEITNFENYAFEPTGDQLIPEVSPESSQEIQTPAEKEEEKALQILINQQRKQQQQFRRRILQLIQSNLE